MAVSFKDKQKYIKQANQLGMPPLLLDWRIKMGFPTQHITATELVDGKYVCGKFDQSVRTAEKPEKTPVGHSYPPRHAPVNTVRASEVKVTVKRSKLRKKPI